MNGKVLALVIIIVVILAGIAYYGLYYYEKSKLTVEESPIESVEFELPQLNVGEMAAQGTSNALENMPSVNPMEGVVNPFEDTNVNPFK